MIGVGFTLQPDPAFLDLLGDVLRHEPDYFEVAPETTWREHPSGELTPNGYARAFAALGDETGKPFVAHGVGLSVGSGPDDRPRRRRWLSRLALDQERFRYRWYTDHLGTTTLAGMAVTLPLALPMTVYAAAMVRRALGQLQGVCPDVGVENTVAYFFVGDARDEPEFLARATSGPGMHLLLDLHNVLTVAENAGFDPAEYLDRLDLSRVIEIHVSGGSYSDPAWLPGGRVMRLDAHDDAVPDEVFRMLERVAPRCPNLRGVTLERMEGTVSQGDVALLRDELRTVRRIVQRPPPGAPRRSREGRASGPPAEQATAGERATAAKRATAGGRATAGDHVAYERALLRVLTARDPGAALAGAAAAEGSAARAWLVGLDEAGVRMAALLVAKLRFERLLRGSPEAEAWFDRDPAAFTEAFAGYHQQTLPRAFFPGHEARLFGARGEKAGG